MATKISKADRDIALAEITAVMAEETTLGVKYFDDTYRLKVRAGRAFFNLFVAVKGDDKLTAQSVKFADIATTLGVDKDHAFLGLRKLATVSEDYIAYRAESVTAGAFTSSVAAYARKNPGKSATSFRAIAPELRDIVNAANNVTTTSNRGGSDETKAAAAKLANDKTVAWNYGFLGAFTGTDADGVKLEWPTADKNMVRGILNRSHVDMAALRAIDKDDVELVRALINGVLDDVKKNGPTVRKDIDTDIPDVAVKTNSKRKTK
jgi:hypothetical protein